MNSDEVYWEESPDSILQRLVEIRRSRLQWGVFVKSAFAAGDLVGEILGLEIEDPEYCSDYCIELDENSVLEPFAPFRYLNHNCNPNCQIVGHDEPLGDNLLREGVWLVAIRNIAKDDELTIDYAWPADLAMRCLCDEPNCRGWIVDEDELHELDASSTG